MGTKKRCLPQNRKMAEAAASLITHRTPSEKSKRVNNYLGLHWRRAFDGAEGRSCVGSGLICRTLKIDKIFK